MRCYFYDEQAERTAVQSLFVYFLIFFVQSIDPECLFFNCSVLCFLILQPLHHVSVFSGFSGCPELEMSRGLQDKCWLLPQVSSLVWVSSSLRLTGSKVFRTVRGDVVVRLTVRCSVYMFPCFLLFLALLRYAVLMNWDWKRLQGCQSPSFELQPTFLHFRLSEVQATKSFEFVARECSQAEFLG